MAVITAILVLGLLVLAGCGNDSGSDDAYDAEEVGGCIGARSGSILTDPLNERPIDFDLRAGLRSRADAKPHVGMGSILPRPTAFAAFADSDPTFVPPEFEGEGFAPAAFVFFETPEAARAHEDEADVRRENVLMVFLRAPPAKQQEFIDDCL